MVLGFRTSLSGRLTRHSKDCFSVQLSKVSSLARFDTPVYFKLTILPCLVYDIGERPSLALGPFRIFTSACLMIKVFIHTRT